MAASRFAHVCISVYLSAFFVRQLISLSVRLSTPIRIPTPYLLTRLTSDSLSPPPLPQHRYEPVEVAQAIPAPVRPAPPPDPPSSTSEDSLLVERRRVLPDKRLVHGRMYLAAWHAGLDAVTDGAVDVVMLAVQVRSGAGVGGGGGGGGMG